MAHREYGNHVAVLNTGHGNPATAEALRVLSSKEGVPSRLLSLDTMGKLAGILHKIMTRYASGAYTEKSTAMRNGKLGDVLAALCYKELLEKIEEATKTQNFDALKLFVVQEFMLLGAKPEELQAIYNEINLVIPDVYPKPSAVTGLQKKEGLNAHILVWNAEAYAELLDIFTTNEVKLFAPFLVEALSQEDVSTRYGSPDVVVKTSGSGGLTEKQALHIKHTLEEAGYSVFVQTPNVYYQTELVQGALSPIVGERFEYQDDTTKRERIVHFYNKLGVDTQAIISYPSEMIQVAAEMMAKGIRVKFIAFEPRGEHEARNLRFAIEEGLCVAVLSLDGNKYTDWGVPTIAYNELPSFISRDVKDATVHRVQKVLGDRPIQEVLRPGNH